MANYKQIKRQQGASGYAKPKGQTLKELDKADPRDTERMKTMNPVDKMDEEMKRAAEAARGITQRVRNIFND
jgi:hypothetical protein